MVKQRKIKPQVSNSGILLAAIAIASTVLSISGCDYMEGLTKAVEEAPEVSQPHLKIVKIADDFKAVQQARIYVPIYSAIYYEDRRRTIDLAATLSVRNTDMKNSIILRSVDYYSTDGKMVKNYLTAPVELGPMSTADFIVARTDVSGGAGANFIVDWLASTAVSLPIAEAVMVSTGSSQSISFVSRGETVKQP
ncbi:hypothetical protein BH11CYA1_BH11CYA1_14700 [soil metagenome]